MGDYDNDGDLDLYVTNGFYEIVSEPNLLYSNNGDGTFTRINEGAIVTDAGSSAGSSWGDYDNSGSLDLLVAGDNVLYLNNADGSFSKHVVESGQFSSACASADFDNDGDLDIFVPHATHNPPENNVLLQNDGNANHWININCVGSSHPVPRLTPEYESRRS